MSDHIARKDGFCVGGADWSLFLDFDGTLVDIVEKPEAVAVDPALPAVLAQLKQRLGGALALVSGRPISFLDARFRPHRFDAAGLHGTEHRIAGRHSPCRPEDHPALREAVDKLYAALETHPGILIEDKGCSVAIHWRMAPHQADFARETAQTMVEALGPDYRIQSGKAVAEILPASSGKGPVIETFLQAEPYRGRCPIFIGDDVTDENGFKSVNAHDGLSVRVGPGATVAQARVGTPAALRHSLQIWADGGSFQLDRIG